LKAMNTIESKTKESEAEQAAASNGG